MSTLFFSTKHILGHRLKDACRFPSLSLPIKYSVSTNLDEYEGLFISYGMISDSLPYTMQNDYDGPLEELHFQSCVLENRFLRAEFIPALGGRLWSLYDKVAKRDLILNNHQFLPGNLAIRNAWLAGGIEWNIGRRGHNDQTCSPRFAASLQDDDGTPVLRIYDFNRDRLIPFQMDFFLPDDSRFLFMRARIHNRTAQTQPVYWWTNIAVEQAKGARIIVPTSQTYANSYKNGHHALGVIKLPDGEGFDGTYPVNFPGAKDHFYKIPPQIRKFETVVFPDGYAFAFCSTNRLQGRKLFVWGQGRGGSHWQRRLMAPDTPDYIEIQGGLTHTQEESLPMPPKTAWEWLEAYGPLQLPPDKCFGDWDCAVKTVTDNLDTVLPQQRLDQLFLRTRTAITLKHASWQCAGSGWGALEQCLHPDEDIAPQLDYGESGPEQADWLQLLRENKMNDDPPTSFMVQDEWFERLRNAPTPGWKILYHLAINWFRRNEMERAFDCLERSLAINLNPWNLHLKGSLLNLTGKHEEAADAFIQLLSQRPDDVPLAKEVLVILSHAKLYRAILEIIPKLSPDVRSRARVKCVLADALAHTGSIDEAEKILLADGGLDIPDVREGEVSASALYIFIQTERARRDGKSITPESIEVPYALDYRMT